MKRSTFFSLHDFDAMAVDKLASGIEHFAADQRRLEEYLAAVASGRVAVPVERL